MMNVKELELLALSPVEGSSVLHFQETEMKGNLGYVICNQMIWAGDISPRDLMMAFVGVVLAYVCLVKIVWGVAGDDRVDWS